MPVFNLPDDIEFPPPDLAEENGLIAIGGDLKPERLIAAYSAGIFPWYSEEQPILWFSPNPRMVLFPENFRVSKSLQRLVNSNKYELRIDADFATVIKRCAKIPRAGQDGTWITSEMLDAYIQLHERGIAHSFETYENGKQVGGLYGVSLGRAFFGESMYHYSRDASKFAFAHLVEFSLKRDFHFIDAQVPTPHLLSLGAEEIDRVKFLSYLRKALDHDSVIGAWS